MDVSGKEAPPSEFFLRDLPLFLDHLAVEKGLAENSLVAYRRDLADFGRHLDEEGLSAGDVGRDDLVRWFGLRRSRGASPRSIARATSAIRSMPMQGCSAYLRPYFSIWRSTTTASPGVR